MKNHCLSPASPEEIENSHSRTPSDKLVGTQSPSAPGAPGAPCQDFSRDNCIYTGENPLLQSTSSVVSHTNSSQTIGHQERYAQPDFATSLMGHGISLYPSQTLPATSTSSFDSAFFSNNASHTVTTPPDMSASIWNSPSSQPLQVHGADASPLPSVFQSSQYSLFPISSPSIPSENSATSKSTRDLHHIPTKIDHGVQSSESMPNNVISGLSSNSLPSFEYENTNKISNSYSPEENMSYPDRDMSRDNVSSVMGSIHSSNMLTSANSSVDMSK